MSNDEIMKFVQLVVTAIQTNHPSSREVKEELTKVLEAADVIAENLTGNRIVIRGNHSVLEYIAGIVQPLSKLPATE